MNLLSNIANLDPTIEGRRHPVKGGMAGPLLDMCDDPRGLSLIPAPIQLLGGKAELHNQVPGQVLRLDFTAFFPPQSDQGGFIAAHDDPGV